jgi:hypothetical protein
MKEEFTIHLRGMPQPEPQPEKGWIRTIHKPTQEELLKSYAQKPVRGVMVIDTHGLCEDGLVIHTNFGFALRNTDNPVRLEISEGATRGEVLYGIQEIAKMLREETGSSLTSWTARATEAERSTVGKKPNRNRRGRRRKRRPLVMSPIRPCPRRNRERTNT